MHRLCSSAYATFFSEFYLEEARLCEVFVGLDLAKNRSFQNPSESDFVLRPLIKSQKVLVVPGSWPWQLCAASLWLCNWAAAAAAWP